MTDRNTQVIIGATLQSSFRTTFRDAVREVDSLNRALGNLTARRNNAGLLGIRDAANQVGTSFSRMRREASSTGRSFQTFERNAGRMGGAMRTLDSEARTAGRGIGSMSRSTSNALNSMRQATQAMREMARATQAQAQAYGRLQSQMNRPLGTPHGGGSFRGRGGGSHGGFGGVGYHGAIHAGFGAVGAGYLAGGLIHKGWEEMAGYAHEVNQRRMQGFSQKQIGDLERASATTSSRVGTLNRRELMKIGGDLGFALTDRNHAALALPAIGEAIALMRSSGMKGDVENQAFGFVKGLEQIGKANTEADITRMMKQFTGVTIATGGRVSGSEFLNYVNRSKGAAMFQSEHFLTHVAPTLMQEMGGASAGNAISMLNNALTGGHMTKEARQTLSQMGLLVAPDGDAALGGSTGAGRSGWLGRNRPHGSFNFGSSDRAQTVKDAKMFQQDPEKWFTTYFVPALRNMNLDPNSKTDQDKIGQILARSFSNQSARRAAAIMLTQDNRILKEGSKIDDAIRAATLDVLKNDPEYQLERVGKMWDNLLSAIGNNAGLMGSAARALGSVADALDKMSHMDPGQLDSIVKVGAAIVGLPTAAFAAGTAMRFLRAGFMDLFALARSPYFIAFAAAGYLIYKNWDWVKGFASEALPGLQAGFQNIGAVFDTIVSAGEKVLHFFGLISDQTDDAAKAFERGATAGQKFGKALEYGLPIITALVVGRKLFQLAAGFRAAALGIGAAEAAAGGGMLFKLLTLLTGPVGMTGLGLLLQHGEAKAVGGAQDTFKTAKALKEAVDAEKNDPAGELADRIQNLRHRVRIWEEANPDRPDDTTKDREDIARGEARYRAMTGHDLAPGRSKSEDELARALGQAPMSDEDARKPLPPRLFKKSSYETQEEGYGNRGLLQMASYGGGGLFTRGGAFDPYGNTGAGGAPVFDRLFYGDGGDSGGGSAGSGASVSGGGGGGVISLHTGRRGLSQRSGRGGDEVTGPLPPIGDAATKALNPRLAASRKAFFDELNRNPQLRRDVIKTASMENRGSVFKMQAVIESMVNRAAMNHYHSLNQAIHSGFYGPVNRGGLSGGLSAKDRADGEKALAEVAKGSNIIGYRTDQGLLTDPGARKYMREADKSGWAKIGGENFFYMGPKGKKWAKSQQDADKSSGSTPASASPAHSAVVGAAKAQQRANARPSPVVHAPVHAPITINAQAHHNEEQIAALAADHIQRRMDSGRDMRSGMYDWVG